MNGVLRCAVCYKPVDMIETVNDPMTWNRIFRAYCHGEVEEATISDLTIVDSLGIQFDTAFRRAKLERPNEKSTT